MYVCSLVLHLAARHLAICDVINDIKLFRKYITVYTVKKLQMFDLSQSDTTLRYQAHQNNQFKSRQMGQ